MSLLNLSCLTISVIFLSLQKNTDTYTFKYATTDTLIIHTHFQFMITSVSFCYKGPGIKTE
jgi:hypothetical protein